MMVPTVLMVAEKPSIAKAIAVAIGGDRGIPSGSGATTVYEIEALFRGKPAHYRITSVAGHVFSIDFPDSAQDWDLVDPVQLFDTSVVKRPTKAAVVTNLRETGKDCDFLVLWLDCDREGEAICFEVIDVVSPVMRGSRILGPQGGILRAKFSAVTPYDIQRAMETLGTPDRGQALAVMARQELDLKVGVAFSRFQTQYFSNKYSGLDSKVLSFGPCQTPTLGFVVQRHLEMAHFQPEPFWCLEVDLALLHDGPHSSNPSETSSSSSSSSIGGHTQTDTTRAVGNGVKRGAEESKTVVATNNAHAPRLLRLEWVRRRVFDKRAAALLFQRATAGVDTGTSNTLVVVSVKQRNTSRSRPQPLNTVEFLKQCSKVLRLGPSQAMQAAERLYLAGFLSYPRTESSAYPKSFDYREALRELTGEAPVSNNGGESSGGGGGGGGGSAVRTGHETPLPWGKFARELLDSSSSSSSSESGGLLFTRPRPGLDAGDHPPITPVKGACTQAHLGSGLGWAEWKVYGLVAKHFLATVSPDARYLHTRAVAVCVADDAVDDVGGCQNEQGDSCRGHSIYEDKIRSVLEAAAAVGEKEGGGGKGKGGGGKGWKGDRARGKSSPGSREQGGKGGGAGNEKDGSLSVEGGAFGECFTVSTETLVDPGFLKVLFASNSNGGGAGDEDGDSNGGDPPTFKSEPPPPLRTGDRFSISTMSSDPTSEPNQQTPPTTTTTSRRRLPNSGNSVLRGVATVRVKEKETSPPTHLTESDLITVMEKEGIGTDASIPTHIENIQKRRYAFLGPNRTLAPTQLGTVLVQGYFRVDKDLVLPDLRCHLEAECDRIASGDVADHQALVAHLLLQFKAKYVHFVRSVERELDPLFEAAFEANEEAKGVPFTRCGFTNRYLSLVPTRPARLYNPTTESLLLLPMGGAYRAYPGAKRCPVCAFELITYVLPDSRTFPLCPYCFNHPQEDVWGYAPYPYGSSASSASSGGGGGSGSFAAVCLECPLGDKHPLVQAVTVCGDGESGGVFVVEPPGVNGGGGSSGPGRRLVSTRSAVVADFPKAVQRIEVVADSDDDDDDDDDDDGEDGEADDDEKNGEGDAGDGNDADAGKEGAEANQRSPESRRRRRSEAKAAAAATKRKEEAGGVDATRGWCRKLAVYFHPQFTPLDGGRTKHVGNLLEDELLGSLLHLKQATPLTRKKGQDGRKPRRARDPRMSFRDF